MATFILINDILLNTDCIENIRICSNNDHFSADCYANDDHQHGNNLSRIVVTLKDKAKRYFSEAQPIEEISKEFQILKKRLLGGSGMTN